MTLPRLHELPSFLSAVDSFKSSGGHRLLIWGFTGDRIREKPILGWGLDAARSIPGGKVEIRPGQSWLSLHPHDAALQVWLELGAPGAVLFAMFVSLMWLRLDSTNTRRAYAAAAGGSLTAALIVAFAGWGIWQEWWLSMLEFALFATLVVGRAASSVDQR
jgi:O-antigen ligase